MGQTGRPVKDALRILVDLAICIMVAILLGKVDRLSDSHFGWTEDVTQRLLDTAARIGRIEAHVESLRLRYEQAAAAAEQAVESVPAAADAAAEKAVEKVVEAVGARDGR